MPNPRKRVVANPRDALTAWSAAADFGAPAIEANPLCPPGRLYLFGPDAPDEPLVIY